MPRSKRFSMPRALAVAFAGGSLMLAGCPGPTARDDASGDTASIDGMDIDACPDPLACYMEFQNLPDGSFGAVYYRSDGSVSSEPCPPVPPGCPVA